VTITSITPVTTTTTRTYTTIMTSVVPGGVLANLSAPSRLRRHQPLQCQPGPT
jgi:hypothetical protein